MRSPRNRSLGVYPPGSALETAEYGYWLPWEVGGLSDRTNGQGQNRTADTVIFSHVLYQLSYLAEPRKGVEL